MIIYVKTLNIPHKKVTANKLKVSEHTVNMKKLVIFLYPKKKKTKETFPFSSIKKNKIFGNKFNQGGKRFIE